MAVVTSGILRKALQFLHVPQPLRSICLLWVCFVFKILPAMVFIKGLGHMKSLLGASALVSASQHFPQAIRRMVCVFALPN